MTTATQTPTGFRALPPLAKTGLWIGGVGALALLVQGVAWLLPWEFDVFDSGGVGNVMVLVFALGGLMLMMAAEKRPIADYGLAIPEKWRPQLLTAFAVGAVSISLVYAAAAATGAARVNPDASAGRVAYAVVKSVAGVPLAVTLSIIFCGYLLSMFRDRHARWFSIAAAATLFMLLQRFEEPLGFLTPPGPAIAVTLILAATLLCQLRCWFGGILVPTGLLAGWLCARIVVRKGRLLPELGDEALAAWLLPNRDPRQAPVVWIALGVAIVVTGLLLRKRPEAVVQQSAGAPIALSFKRHYPFANMGMLATLDVWLAQLWRAKFRVGGAYIPRLVSSLVSSAINTVLSLPERILAPLLLRARQTPDPVFIVGVHRSGTTHLQNLLALDPQFECARTYQVVNPHGFLTTGWIFVPVLKAFSPWKRPMDSVSFGVFSPNEEEYAIANASGLSPDWGVRLPREINRYDRFTFPQRFSQRELARWKRLYSRFVAKLAAMRRRRPLLKNPYNTARVGALRSMYPDARFIHIHRDPYRVYRSNMHLAREGHTLFQLQDPLDNDSYSTRFLDNYRAMEESYYYDAQDIPADRAAEVRYEDLDENALAEVKRIYDALGLDYTPKFDARLRAYLDSVADYKKNTFKPLDPDLTQRINDALAPLFEKWGRTSQEARTPAGSAAP